MKNKKAISEIVSTVLIIGFTIILAIIMFSWSGTFIKSLTKEQESKVNIQTECAKLNFKIEEVKLGLHDGVNCVIGTFSNNNAKKIEDFMIQVIKTDGRVWTWRHEGLLISLDAYQKRTDELPVYLIDGSIQPLEPGDKARFIPKIKVSENEYNTCPAEYSQEKAIIQA